MIGNDEAKRRMKALVDSCGSYEQVVQSLMSAIEEQWADETSLPPCFCLALNALSAAADLCAVVDLEMS